MRVAHVIPSLAVRTGGPPVAVVESALALTPLGVDSVIYTTDLAEAPNAKTRRRLAEGDFPDGYADLDIRVFPAVWRRMAFSPALSAALATGLREVDVVHIHTLFLHPTLAAYRASRRGRVPYVVAPCGALDPSLRHRSRFAKRIVDSAWQRKMMDGAAFLHFKTEEERRLASDLGYRAPTRVVPNGVRSPGMRRVSERHERRPSRSDDRRVVLYLGRLSHKKGLDLLIQAFAYVVKAVPGARLVIAGPDDEGLTPSLVDRAASAGIADKLTIKGMLSGEAKAAALQEADVWVLPSRTENFGIAFLEALSAGVPAVVSNAVNLAADAEAFGAARAVDLDARALSDAIEATLKDAAGARDMAARGVEFSRRFAWDVVAPSLLQMYELASRRAADRPAESQRTTELGSPA